MKFEVDIPAEVLAKGWPPVLQYLRELEEQVGPRLTTSRVCSLLCKAHEESHGRVVRAPPCLRLR